MSDLGFQMLANMELDSIFAKSEFLVSLCMIHRNWKCISKMAGKCRLFL